MVYSREIHLKRHPDGLPQPSDFELVEVEIPPTPKGGVLVENLWMSVDPYMRGRMRARKSYAAGFELGSPMNGGAIGQIIESDHPDFSPNSFVLHNQGWRQRFVSDAADLESLQPGSAPLESYLGLLGMPGHTAYVGLFTIGQAQPGETVLVSAAAGAVGSAACQMAKINGCKVVGLAGSDAKVAWLLEEAGVDQALNYKTSTDLYQDLAAACPAGVDVYFDNVGGPQLQLALDLLNQGGRVASCGMISTYNDPNTAPTPGPNNLFQIIVKRLRIEGFLVFDHAETRPAFVLQMSQWLAEGKIKQRQTIFNGLEQATQAFIGLFSGENFGKMLVKLAEPKG